MAHRRSQPERSTLAEGELRRWADDLAGQARRGRDPWLIYTAVLQRLASLPADAAEREAIYDFVIEWVASQDLDLWHPALMVLSKHQVRRAAPAVRAAVASATSDNKNQRLGVIEQVATALEAPPVVVDPAAVKRWDEFEAAVYKAIDLVHGFGGDTQSVMRDFWEQDYYALALGFGVADIERNDRRPLAREVSELLIPEFEYVLEDDGLLDADDREWLAKVLETLKSVVAPEPGAPATGEPVSTTRPSTDADVFKEAAVAPLSLSGPDMTLFPIKRLPAILDVCERHAIGVLGVELFERVDGGFKPRLDALLDLGDESSEQQSIADARRFVERYAATELVGEIVLAL